MNKWRYMCFRAIPTASPHNCCSHVLSLLHVEQVLALHRLLQQRSVLQHQRLNLAQQVAVLLLQVALQLAEQLDSRQAKTKHQNQEVMS